MPKEALINTVTALRGLIKKILRRTILITIGTLFSVSYSIVDYFTDNKKEELIILQKKQINKGLAEKAELVVANTSLLVRVSKNAKWSNSAPWAEWVKEYNPRTERIIMMWYNQTTYKYILKPLGFTLYHYILKSDFEVFETKTAQGFYDEEIKLVKKFLDGDGSMVIEFYNKPWTNLNGVVDKKGYWRYVWGEEGHIYIGGRTDQPVTFKK